MLPLIRCAGADLRGVRLLLVNPGIYDDPCWCVYPPWGAVYVAAACRERGAEVQVVDLNGEPIGPRMRELVADFDPTVIGVTGKLGKGAARMRQVIEAAGEASDAPVAVGGPLVSTFLDPAHPLWSGVRARFWGDGEVDFPSWIANGCLPIKEVRPGRPADLDELGLPAWWESLGDYVSDGEFWPGLEVRSVHVSVARGCTRRCTFCYLNSHYADRSFRVIERNRLLAGFDALNARWGAEGFYVVDDCFLRPRSPETEGLLSTLVRRGSPYRFGCDLQIQEVADGAFLQRMWNAGFRALYVGVEAASASVRRKLGKGICAVPMHDAVLRALDLGFVIRASVGIGWPGETQREMEETLELIRSLPGLAIDAFRYTPLPGAPLTTYWARGASTVQRREAHDPFADYSEFSRNHSAVADAPLEGLWNDLLALERERHAAYFRVSVLEP